MSSNSKIVKPAPEKQKQAKNDEDELSDSMRNTRIADEADDEMAADDDLDECWPKEDSKEEEVDDGKVAPPADADASRACRLTMLRARSALRIRCAGAGAESVDAVNSSAAAVRKSVSSAR